MPRPKSNPDLPPIDQGIEGEFVTHESTLPPFRPTKPRGTGYREPERNGGASGRPRANPDDPNIPGEKLLLAIARHHALSVSQAAYACGYAVRTETTEGSESHVHENLLRMMGHGYLRRVTPMERNLKPMYLLDARGKRYLAAMGVPYDEKTGNTPPIGIHLSHRQAVTWVLLKIEKSGYPILEMRNEWQLSRESVRLSLADGTKVNYAPDAWVKLLIDDEEISIAIELDRGTEEQKVWRQKVLQMVAFTSRDSAGKFPFQELFGTDRIRFAVAVAPGAIGVRDPEVRARNLVHWTQLELAKHEKLAWAEKFFIRPLDASLATPDDILFQPCWAHPGGTELVPLIGGAA
jgi:hypothetical protein